MPTLETVQPKRPRRTPNEQTLHGVTEGVLVGFTPANGNALVTYPGQPGSAALPARSTIDLHGDHVGAPVALLFQDGDPARPIIVGSFRVAVRIPADGAAIDLTVDDERLIVSAANQIVLRCGKASIVLTKAGKIIIRGTYLTTESSGVHRIRGGSVQIN